MKQFLRYILTLVAIFIATTNIWADCVIFSDGGSYEVMNGLSQRKEKNFTNIPALPAGLLTFTYSASGAAIGGVDVTATYSDGTSATILSSSRVSNPSYNFNGKIVTKLTFKGTSGTLKKTISNVQITRHTSISASPATLSFPLTAVGATSAAQTVTITYSNIGNNYNITSTNTNDFSISPLPFTYDKCGGEMQFAITFHPQGTTGGARSGSFTIAGDGNGKSNNNTSVTINVSGTAKGFPEFTWKGNTQYYVDESLDLSNLWTTTSNETTPKYSIKRFTSTDTFGSADPHFTDGTNTKILLSKEGELVIQMHQDASTTYSPLTKEVTITIVKRPTDFSLNFANEYFVDDEINKSTFFTNATNSEVAVQVSDKTADNRAMFTYNGSILKANGATLNADAETTTITVTQPETYKWTGKTLTKEVIVKKYPTDFNWLLQNTYYVGETITSIFTKTNNSLPSTIASSDPTIVKVENNQLIALRAGKVRITVSQAVDRKWVAFTHEKEITIIKRNTNFQLLLGTTYYVDDRIAKSNIYSKANENPLPVNIVSSNPNILEYDATTQQLIARNAGKATITVSQAKDTTWTDFNQSLEVTILKHNIVATITPDNVYWNELVPNPFAATSTHPVSGQVTTFQDHDFNVTQQGNEHIALMDANTRNIQTYYTNGTVDFHITRPEDRKYNALNQTLTLTVNANSEDCLLTISTTNVETGNGDNSTSGTITIDGIGEVLSFNYKLNNNANVAHYLTTQYSTTDTGDNFLDIAGSTVGEEDKTLLFHSLTLPPSTKRIRFKRTDDGWGDKKFEISNITVTRAQYIRPTDDGQALNSTNALVLPPVAINLPRSKPFNLEWSACSDIKITCDNPKFTISTTDISAVSGSQNITITCNTSEIGTFIGDVTIYNQEQKETFPVICEVYTKWLTDSISGSATHSMKVDEPWNTDFYFPVQRASQYPTTDGAFHYAIEHTFVDADPADRNPNHPNEVISYNNGVITAHNAGTAILTIKHDETDEHFESQQFTCTLTVSKHDVELQWKDPVYFNDTVYNYFTTSNTTSHIDIESQTDTDVAKLTNEFNPTSNNSLDLITFNKVASTTVTVSQVETYYWNGYSKPHTITPIDQNNHVTFTLTQENYIPAFKHSFVDPAANDQSKGPDWQSGGIYFGGEGAFEGAEGWNWDEKYYIIQFTGIPDSIYFDASRSGTATGTIKLSVSEGKTPDNLTEVWSNSNNSENNKIIRKLNPDSRYLKFSYTGNLWGLFKNITVTELNEFRAVDSQNKTLDKDTLDFGANQVYRNKTRTFELRYANPGYKITVESTNPKFTVTPDFIGDIGGEYHGTRTITVSYTSTVPDTISGEDMIIIKDELGEEHSDTIRLYASSYKAEQVLHWRADFEAIPTPIIRTKNGDITDAAWATSQLPVTYTSSNENVIKISDDGTTLIPVAEGQAEITAYQLGNEMWLPADPITKTFIVTDKLLQYIVWDDDLTNIIKDDTNPQTLPLTAQVYLQQEDGTLVFSPEQTNQLTYQSGNSYIVSVSGNTLTINNVGNTTLTATVEGNNDYATASMTKTVIVRPATLGCEDNLLYHHEGDPIQFFQYNMDEIIKEPISLDRSKGEAGYVVISHYGQSWNLAIQYYAAEIRVEQSLDNCSTWSTVETIKPVKNQENIDSIPLSRQATHIRFVRNDGGQGYQFLYNIDVHPAQYIEAQDVVDFGEIHVGSRETRTFPLHYSNIKHSLSPVPSTSEVTATPNTFGECSGFGTQDISVTWLPTQVSDNATATITFTDPNSRMEKEVKLVAKVFKGKQNIIWDNIPNIIEDCGSILFPEKTTANLPITWTVIQGKEYADFNKQGMLEIYKNGTITVQATQEGTANYEPLTPVQYTFVIQLQTIFVGTEDSNWDNPNNWTMCRLPYTDEVVTIEAPATLSIHDTVAGITFTTGTIHITHMGGLTINEAGVTNAATNGSSITIDNNPQGAGFLLISPSAPEDKKYPYFTMNFTTRAFNEGVPRDETWQYMGAPGNNATFKNLDSQTLIYHWDETNGWTPYTVNGSLPTWNGYALTQSIKTNHTYNITAQAMQGSQTINLTRTEEGMKGDNLFVNSFTAPIDITKIDPTTDVTGDWNYQTFYLFNTGSWNDWQGVNPDNKHDASSPGHYYTIPILSAQHLDDAQTVIPPMQGVYVHTEAPATIKLDYSKHVWNGTPDNTPMRAPQKQAPDFRRIRIQASSQNSGADRMYIIQESSTTRGYDNGYDGKNINAKGQVNIYTNEPFGKMEVSCANNIDSMYIGFRAGSDSQYQLTFGSLVGDSLYLKDLNDNTIIRMEEGGIYHFFAEPNSVNHSRFQILLHPSEVAGDNTTTGDHQVCQAKIWTDHQYLYITDAPIASQAIIYAISGQRVASYTVNDSYYTIPLSSLNSGIYILQINNQRYKFVWK